MKQQGHTAEKQDNHQIDNMLIFQFFMPEPLYCGMNYGGNNGCCGSRINIIIGKLKKKKKDNNR